MQQRRSVATDTIVFIAAVALNVALLNMLGVRLSARADLTKDQIFTLAPGTVRILGGLEDTLTIKVYLTKDLPAPFNQLPRFLEDKLDEYRVASGGKLTYEVINPEDDQKLRREARDQGIVQGQVQAIKADKVAVNKVYMGMVMFYGNQKDVIPWIPEGQRHMAPIYEYMEYNLSARIRKLTRGAVRKKKVGFLAGHGELDLAREVRRAADVLRKADYEVVSADLSGKKTLPGDLDLLIVAGPKKKLDDRAKWEIDQHLMRGKPVAFFLDAISLKPQRGMLLGSPNQDNLHDMVASYGVKVEPGIVLDERCIEVPVPAHQRLGNLVIRSQVLKPYPPIVAVTRMARHPLSRGVPARRFILPFPAPLAAAEKLAGREAVPLALSSAEGWKMGGSFFLLNPNQDYLSPWKREVLEALDKARRTGDESGLAKAETKAAKLRKEQGPPKNADGRRGFPLVYVVHGKFKSFFAGKPLPKEVAKGSATVPESKPTQIMVIGTSFFLQDNFLAPGNRLFLQNAVDWLLQDQDLIGLRARTFAAPPLETVEGAKKELVRYANVLGVPLLLIAFGIIRWAWRRRRKANVTL